MSIIVMRDGDLSRAAAPTPAARRQRRQAIAAAARRNLKLKGDIQSPEIEVRFTPNFGHSDADVRFSPDYVCFTPKSGHSEAYAGLPLLTHSGHRARD